MLAALIVAISMGIMNGFHVSWGTGHELNNSMLMGITDHG